MSVKDRSFDNEEKFGGGIQQLETVALEGVAGTDEHGHALFARDEAAEARIRRKTDFRIIPVIFVLYLFCFIDRANIGNAKIAGFEKDLKLKGYQYNILLSAFYTAYAAFEIPALMLCKKIGPHRFLPLSTMAFGLFAMCTGFVHTFGQAVPVRFLLGIAEGAVFPGMALYLSRFYRKDELAFRLALYVVGAPLAGAFGGLLASAILKLHGFGFIRTWRMIFVIEGIITMGLGFIAFFLLPEGPGSASWLKPEERALAVARIKGENVGSTVVVDKMHSKAIRDGMFSPTTLVTALVFMLDNITVQGMGFFLPTIIGTIYPRTTTVYKQLRTVPPYIVGAVFTLGIPFAAWKTNRRLVYMIAFAPCIMIGYSMFVASHNPHVRYGAAFVIAIGAFSFGALTNALVVANTTSDSMRAGAIGVNVFAGNLGGLVSTWCFLPDDAPQYRRGNSINLGTGTGMFVLCIGLLLWHTYQNKQKEKGNHDHELDGKSQEEIEHLGRRHPAFRYKN